MHFGQRPACIGDQVWPRFVAQVVLIALILVAVA